MSRLKNISGFPEWLPEQKLVEQQLIEKIRAIYTSFGFTPIETPAVELLSTLRSKGEVDKEIYAIRRLHADPGEEAELGLHFDLTVPFARYVAQHFSKLSFPFKRYQLQKVWRGERPQKGRFREFYQFDVDIIARDELPVSADAEVVTVLDRVFEQVKAGPYLIRLNNRKVLLGLYTSLGLDREKAHKAVGVVDKIAKIGRQGVLKELSGEGIDLDAATSDRIADLAEIKITPSETDYVLSSLDIDNKLFVEGKQELVQLISYLDLQSHKHIQIDLSLARGLDYYTGSIVEVVLEDHPAFGSVASGGRYDDLASQFINKKLPGVGVSFGLTRFLELAFSQEIYKPDRKTPAEVFVTVADEEQRTQSNVVADKLRAAGLSVEVCLGSPRLGKQIEHADNKQIRYVAFVNDGAVEIKDLVSKEQGRVDDLEGWARGLERAG